MPDWMSPSMPDWMSSKPSQPAVQPLRFESDPPGADVHTSQGQSCMTPCSLAVPSESQAVNFAKNGFVPQTIQVRVGDPPEHSFWESPPPSLVPNPVRVVLQVIPPPKPVVKPKPHKSVQGPERTRTAAKMTPPGGSADAFAPAPPMQQPAASPVSSPFPPPPPIQPVASPASSPFPPPPQTH
jgi:hypothetical protein